MTVEAVLGGLFALCVLVYAIGWYKIRRDR